MKPCDEKPNDVSDVRTALDDPRQRSWYGEPNCYERTVLYLAMEQAAREAGEPADSTDGYSSVETQPWP